MLKDSVGESEVIKSLQDEITRQKSLIETRDNKVKELMESEQTAQKVKEEIKRDLEVVKREKQIQEERVKEKEDKIKEQERLIEKQKEEIAKKEVVEKIVYREQSKSDTSKQTS